jgi:DoxX-like protein
MAAGAASHREPSRPDARQAKEEEMLAAYVITTVVTIAANAWAARADLAQAKWVLANMDEVCVPRSWLLPLAALKGAGAAGLLLGLLGVWPLGIAAAAGLVLFFTGALTAHVRARAFHNIAFPGAYLALATASAALAIAAR